MSNDQWLQLINKAVSDTERKQKQWNLLAPPNCAQSSVSMLKPGQPIQSASQFQLC